MNPENITQIPPEGHPDHPLSLERTLDRALQWIEDGDLEDAKAALRGIPQETGRR